MKLMKDQEMLDNNGDVVWSGDIVELIGTEKRFEAKVTGGRWTVFAKSAEIYELGEDGTKREGIGVSRYDMWQGYRIVKKYDQFEEYQKEQGA